MKKSIYILIISCGLLLSVAYIGISYALLSGLISGSHKPLSSQTPDTTLCDYETVSFSPRGEDFNLEGWFLKPKKKAIYTLIFVHGIATNRISNKHTLNIAYNFLEKNFNVLMFDLRTQGNSEGNFASASYFEKFDVLGAFDFLTNEKKIPSEDIGLLGFSMGGATALLASSIEPNISALAIDSPFSDARKLIAQETAKATGVPYFFAKLFVPMVRLLAEEFYNIDIDEMVPEEAVKKINFPIYLIHGDADTRLSHTNSRRIHKNAHKESELFIVPNGGHTESYALNKTAYIRRLFSYYMRRKEAQLF